MSTHPKSAEVVQHHYSTGVPFYMVKCEGCLEILNSGHHYAGSDLHHAVALADAHNVAIHKEEP